MQPSKVVNQMNVKLLIKLGVWPPSNPAMTSFAFINLKFVAVHGNYIFVLKELHSVLTNNRP